MNIGEEALWVSSNSHNNELERHVLKAHSFPSNKKSSKSVGLLEFFAPIS